MMHYYIDGYNLLFRVLRAGDDLKTQREEILQDLEIKVNLLELDVSIVFDSQYQISESTRSHRHRLEILFTETGQTADEYILQALKESKAPSQHIVVTSDKKLAWLSRRRFAKTESVEEFISWLNKRYKNRLKQNKIKPKQETVTPHAKSPTSSTFAHPQSQQMPSTDEEYLAYYLEIFEQRACEIPLIAESKPDISASSPDSPRKKKKKKKDSPQQDFLSDAERWLKAFERNPEEDWL